MKLKISLFLIFACASALGQQCTAASDGGTNCPGPLHINEPTTPQSIIYLTPATPANPCVAVAGKYSLCAQNSQITVDYGDGRGFVTLQGATGATGPQGIQGIPGPQGPAGAQGVMGPKGDQGATGANGLDGQPGAQGADGAVGPVGATGLKGDPGDPGPKGDTGAQGIPGPSGATLPFTATCDVSSFFWDATGLHAQVVCH